MTPDIKLNKPHKNLWTPWCYTSPMKENNLEETKFPPEAFKDKQNCCSFKNGQVK